MKMKNQQTGIKKYFEKIVNYYDNKTDLCAR
jgi:hypothetical protein